MEELLERIKQGFLDIYRLEFQVETQAQAMGTPFRKGRQFTCQMTNFARGFSAWCEIWPFRNMKKPPCKISQGGFSPCEIWTFHLPPLRNAFEISCFETLLVIFHYQLSKIFCLTFSCVNTYFTLVINQWKGCFCNSSCNLAFYCL